MKKIQGNPETIAVLGGGPAGLSAAWKLGEAGKKVIVVEKYSIPGGLCRTIQHGDFIFDLGGHRFLTQDQTLLEEIVNLMGDDLLGRPRTSVILLRNKYFKYPLDSKDLIFKMNPFISLKCFLDYLFTRIKCKLIPQPDNSFEDWVVNRFGRSLYNIYFGPYSKKLWGISPTKIAADWSAQRISLLNLWDVFLRLFLKKKDTPKTYATEFLYPKKGIGQIADKMVDRITANGGEILYDLCAKEIHLENNSIKEIIATDKEGKERIITADYYISSVPIDAFILGTSPAPDKKYVDAASKMTYRGVLLLFITIDLPKITDNTWMYIPEDKYFFFRIQEPKNWSPTLVPEGKTSLILEVACSKGDDVWNMKDADIFEQCVLSLKKLNLFNTDKIMDYFTLRIGHAYPIYDLDYKGYVQAALEFVYNLDNAICIGREGLYRYNNMDHSIKMGFMSADYIQGKISYEDILTIASENEVFESKQATL